MNIKYCTIKLLHIFQKYVNIVYLLDKKCNKLISQGHNNFPSPLKCLDIKFCLVKYTE